MRCPNCDSHLSTITCQGLDVETCGVCRGEWLDAGELGEIVRRREKRFGDDRQEALIEAPRVPGVPIEEIEREIECPKCGVPTVPINYAVDTGIIIDRCPECRGIWIDAEELEKIRALVESLRQHGRWRREPGGERRSDDRVATSGPPLVAGIINAIVNGVLDLS